MQHVPPKLNGKGAQGAPNKRSDAEKAEAPSAGGMDKFAAGYDFLLINSPMEDDLFFEVAKCVAQGRASSKVVAAVVTLGGLAGAAYRIGRYLQTTYDEVVIFVPSLCKSAGTLLATAGHE